MTLETFGRMVVYVHLARIIVKIIMSSIIIKLRTLRDVVSACKRLPVSFYGGAVEG